MSTIYLVANGDMRTSANRKCEAEQRRMEQTLIAAIKQLGGTVRRAHEFRESLGHSFIDSQKYGMEVFKQIPSDAPLIIAEAVWQYSHHLLHGLMFHQGPILTVAKWSGMWPGLVGMLNLNGSMAKAGIKYSTLWSEDFENDQTFLEKLGKWMKKGKIEHDTAHVKPWRLAQAEAETKAMKNGIEIARSMRRDKAIMGVFDEGCMGMFNAIIPDCLLHPLGVFKERLSQSSLYYAMTRVSDAEANAVYDWYKSKGVTFHLGKNAEAELTEEQVLQQCKMYIAALRIADEFGCATIGIQYQQGLKDLCPASDLVEGTLNNVERPPVKCTDGRRELYAGEALPHFNEVDECAGLDGLLTYKLWRKLGYAPENTLHDLRWGRHYKGKGKNARGQDADLDAYVWVFEISGGAPPKHFRGGWAETHSYRQPPMYFRLGGGTCSGVSKCGDIVWSRIFIQDNRLKMDIGLGEAVGLPTTETRDRLDQTTSIWPIMHAVLKGVTRNQMMTRHLANHIQVAYAPSPQDAKYLLVAKASAAAELGLDVFVCGNGV